MAPIETQPVQVGKADRRSFLAGLLAAEGATVGALLAIPPLRFTLHPVLAPRPKSHGPTSAGVDEFQNLDAPVKKLVTIEQRDGWRKIVLMQELKKS